MTLLRWGGDRIRGAFNSWVEALILAAGIGLALLIWRLLRPHLSEDVSLPTWLPSPLTPALACASLVGT